VRGYGLRSVDGVPVWEQAADRHNRACVEQHPERTRILFFGSSITFGTGLNADEAFSAALEARLNQARPVPGFCVLNFAQPGFSFEQKYAVARIEVPRYQPALIMWENWVEWADYRLIGDAAYGIGKLRVRDDGFVGLSGVPDALNRLLFLNSYLYQYVVLTFGENAVIEPGPHGVTVFAQQRLSKVVTLAQSVGAKLVMYPSPPLDQPFSETAAQLPDWHARIVEFADAQGVPAYPLQRELVDQDYLALRLDPCCHFNAAGHRALVPVMERIVMSQLDSATARQ
jgi:lysophospholipase L1-like esterase